MRLRKLQEENPGKFTITHKAFILRPDHNPDAKFTQYHLEHRERAADITGLPFALPKPGTKYPSSSFPAQLAAKWVQRHYPFKFEQFDAALFDAFFERIEDISDAEVLANIARLNGIDPFELKAALSDKVLREQTISDHEAAQRMGINGIPAVVIGTEIITGAVPIEQYRQSAMRLIAAHRLSDS